MQFEGKTVLVTGGARGIGRAAAEAFAGRGARVAVNDLKEAEETVNRIRKAGGEAASFPADVSKAEQVDAMFDEIKKSYGVVNVLVNNAGILRDGSVVLMKEENFDEVIAVHLKGAFLCSRKALRGMIAAKSGRIINIVSPSGLTGREGQANYSAAKGGLVSMTYSLAREMVRFNILVNAVSPGVVETEMTDSLPEKVKKQLLDAIPMKRMASPEEIAGAILFLAGPDASYITGQVLRIDGGLVIG